MRISWYFEHYFSHLLNDYPLSVWVIIGLFIIASLFLGLWKGWRKATVVLILGYSILVLYFTVFSRPSFYHMRYCLRPFFSYSAVLNGDRYLLPQIIMNIALFIPFGLLMKVLLKDWSFWTIIVFGLLSSMTVELLQLLFQKGVAEIDDVIHNVIGCVLGVMIANVFNLIHKS